MRVSAKTGEGVDAFRAWLQALPAREPAGGHHHHDHAHHHEHADHDHEHATA
jgi:ABC-type Zn2+ transport system substrate-binding protein/surface adhesin